MLPRSSGDLIPLGSGDPSDILHYNPFAGHSESSFSSAVKLSEGRVAAGPVYRRRGSESAARKDRRNNIPVDEDGEYPGPNSHVRSRTTDYASTTSASTHPLAQIREPPSSRNQISSDGTRPRLNRNLSDLEPFHGGSAASPVFHNDQSSAVVPDRGPAEKIVIVHEVWCSF